MEPATWDVILAEDLLDDITVISRILRFHGITVHIAQNGTESIALLAEVKPTLIVTDLRMPEQDGWQVLTAVRNNPQTAHIPVVAITAYHSPEVAEAALNAGFNGYFPKPIYSNTFVESLRQLLPAS